MDVSELSLKWAEYRYKLKTFERNKEEEIRRQSPHLSDTEIEKKVSASVNRKFKQESRELMGYHFIITNTSY